MQEHNFKTATMAELETLTLAKIKKWLESELPRHHMHGSWAIYFARVKRNLTRLRAQKMIGASSSIMLNLQGQKPY